IGGDRSHEFQVVADTGEDLIVYNPRTQYAANMELAEAPCLLAERAAPSLPLTDTPTPGAAKCADVAAMLGVPLSSTVKSIVLATEPEKGPVKIWLLLLRGDHELNEIKASKIEGLKNGFRFATEREIEETFGCLPGYLGPINTRAPVTVVADLTVANMADFICGANHVDAHFTGVNWGRDVAEPHQVADLRNVVEGDRAPDDDGPIAIQRGIEVGHVFFLGTKYSEALKATYLDETGKPALLQMGCYGIGVTRIVGAAIEQNHDGKGIIWPRAISPFEVVICCVGWGKSETVRDTANALYESLKARGVDVIIDDRDARPGVMFAEWELIGVPLRVTVGERGLKEGVVELQTRRATEATKLPADAVLEHVLDQLESI
ncbi:MAG: proline--tRNA ligase, partial [Comamonadaceae bacterium]